MDRWPASELEFCFPTPPPESCPAVSFQITLRHVKSYKLKSKVWTHLLILHYFYISHCNINGCMGIMYCSNQKCLIITIKIVKFSFAEWSCFVKITAYCGYSFNQLEEMQYVIYLKPGVALPK